MIELKNVTKTFGSFTAEAKLFTDVVAKIKISVISTK